MKILIISLIASKFVRFIFSNYIFDCFQICTFHLFYLIKKDSKEKSLTAKEQSFTIIRFTSAICRLQNSKMSIILLCVLLPIFLNNMK